MKFPCLKSILLLISSLLLFGSCATTGGLSQKKDLLLEVEALRSDIEFSYTKLKQLHPSLYAYISQERLDSLFEEANTSIREPLTSKEFYLHFSPVIASIRQGHTTLKQQGPQLRLVELFREIRPRSPLHQLDYELFDDAVYIKKGYTKGDPIQAGTRLVSVNGHQAEALLAKYSSSLSADGYITSFTPWIQAQLFPDFAFMEFGKLDEVECEFNYQDSIFSRVLPIEQPEKPDKIEKKDRELRGYNDENQTYSQELTFIEPDSSIALLKVSDFMLGNQLKFSRDCFKMLDSLETEVLILDLRDNPGGELSKAQGLYTYLTDSAFAFIQESEVTSKESMWYGNYFHGTSLGINMILALGYPLELLGRSILFLLTEQKEDHKYYTQFPQHFNKEASPHRFDGQLYVLINGGTYSAASILAANLKGSGRAQFVGTETGGAASGTVAGRLTTFTLPESKLELQIGLALIKPFYPAQVFGRGVFPDIEVIPSLSDRINGQDPELNRVLEEISKLQK